MPPAPAAALCSVCPDPALCTGRDLERVSGLALVNSVGPFHGDEPTSSPVLLDVVVADLAAANDEFRASSPAPKLMDKALATGPAAVIGSGSAPSPPPAAGGSRPGFAGPLGRPSFADVAAFEANLHRSVPLGAPLCALGWPLR
jgi:hypothetical protein